MNDALERLLSAAIRAPSGDNTQPWRFEVESGAGRVVFLVDETRDPSPMNSGQRMARIAVGAALETFLRTAGRSGWEVRLETPVPPAVAVVHVQVPPGAGVEAEKAVADRVTNRRAYDGRPVPDDVLARLKSQAPPLEGVTTHWVVGRERLEPLADLIGRSDATMFGEATMRRAFLHNVRFDAPPDATVEEGLSLDSLELSAKDRKGLKLMPWMPSWLLRLAGGLRLFAETARRLITSASGLCLVVAPDRVVATDLTVGRAMQRAWLALTAEGLAVQPMMSLPVLDNALEHGTPELVASLGREKVEGLLAELRRLAPEVGDGRLAYLMRFGYAPAPSGRTGRLPLPAVVKEVAR
jgi:nitroreductase